MKATLWSIIAGVFLVGWTPVTRSAAFGNLQYESNGFEITITGYTGSGEAVAIPDEIDGLPVTGIGDYAFQARALTSVRMGNNVRSIGNNAFEICSSLTTATLNSGVTDIGHRAFQGCTRLVTFTIPSTVTSIGGSLLGSCSSLTHVTIEEGVLSLGDGTFRLCTRLTEVTIPSSVGAIGIDAFAHCTSLRSIIIPDSVTYINLRAFLGCLSLTNVTIPEHAYFVAPGAFANCIKLTEITVDPLNSDYRSMDGVLFDKSRGTLIQCPGGKAGGYTIPDSVNIIEEQAFSGSINLTAVTIPSSVASIGPRAFESCTKLAGVYFEGNAPSLGTIPQGSVFANSGRVIAYYLPETTGWDTTFGGRPTAIWTPQLRTSDATFGIRSNQFGFTIAWATGRSVVVEGSVIVDDPTWSPIATLGVMNGSAYFSDPQWTNYSSRFYRLRPQ